MAAGEWLLKLYHRTTWRMNLRQYSVRAIRVSQYARFNFLFVDQSSSRALKKIGEDIPSSSEGIGAHMLNFWPKF